MLRLQSDGEKQGELHGQQESRNMLVAHPAPGTLLSKMFSLQYSIVPDRGSGVFLTPGSGIRFFRITDPGTSTHISESSVTIFG
jgi:hypothetical protein